MGIIWFGRGYEPASSARTSFGLNPTPTLLGAQTARPARGNRPEGGLDARLRSPRLRLGRLALRRWRSENERRPSACAPAGHRNWHRRRLRVICSTSAVQGPWPLWRALRLILSRGQTMALSRQISKGDFRRRIRPSATVIREQKQWSSSAPLCANRQYRIYSDNARQMAFDHPLQRTLSITRCNAPRTLSATAASAGLPTASIAVAGSMDETSTSPLS